MLKLLGGSNSKLAIENSRSLLTNYRVEFFRQYRRRTKQPWGYELDEYRRKIHEYRLKNIKEFWDRQSLFENEHIENYLKQQEEKHNYSQLKLRTSIVKEAFSQHRNREMALKFEEKRQNILRQYMFKSSLMKSNREKIIKYLLLDSQGWITKENLNERVTAEFLSSNLVMDHNSYYRKLQELAIYAERADYKAMEEVVNDRHIIKYKNSRMIPLYQEIVSLIKHLNNSEEKKIVKDYYYDISLIRTNEQLSEPEKQEKEQTLRVHYQALLQKVQNEEQQPEKKIDIIHNQLILLYNLLILWDKYVTYMKMDSTLIKMEAETEYEGPKVSIQTREFDAGAGGKDEKASYADALTSASEKFTTDEEEELNEDKLRKLLKKAGKSGESSDYASTSSVSGGFTATTGQSGGSTSQAEASEKEDLYAKLTGEDVFFEKQDVEKENEKELEEQFEKMLKEKKGPSILYGLDREEDQAVDINEYLKKIDVDNVFPEHMYKDLFNYDKISLKFEGVEAIDEFEREFQEGVTPNKLTSSSVVEIYKKKIDQLGKEQLTRKEKKKLADVRRLLDKVGELSIDETRMLYRVYRAYSVGEGSL